MCRTINNKHTHTDAEDEEGGSSGGELELGRRLEPETKNGRIFLKILILNKLTFNWDVDEGRRYS